MKLKAYIFSSIYFFAALNLFALQGQYEGILDFELQKLRIVTDFSENEGKTSLVMYSPDQSPQAIPASSLSINKEAIFFTQKDLKVEFKGKIKGDKISGNFTQFGKSVPLVLSKNDKKRDFNVENSFALPENIQKELLGAWSGKLKVNSLASLDLKLVFERAGAKIKSHIISINQGGARILVDSISCDKDTLKIKASSVGLSMSLKLSKTALAGTFTQGALKQNISFKKE